MITSVSTLACSRCVIGGIGGVVFIHVSDVDAYLSIADIYTELGNFDVRSRLLTFPTCRAARRPCAMPPRPRPRAVARRSLSAWPRLLP